MPVGVNINNLDLTKHLLVDEKLKVIYSFIPKSGCTTWKHLWKGNLSGKAVKGEEYTHMTYINKYGLKFVSQYPVKERDGFLTDDTFIKFLVVRHPYDRLLSAYADKFVNDNFKL